MKSKIIVKALITLGAGLALFLLYFYKLESFPSVVHGDEAETALQALKFLKDPPSNVIGVGWAHLPLLSFIPHAVSMQLFGQNIAGDRIGSAIFGVATLPFFYFFLKLLFEKKIALLATVLLGSSHLWIALSRIGLTCVHVSFFLSVTLYFLFLGIKTNKIFHFILSGIFMGLGLYSYSAAKALPIIVLPPILFYLIKAGGLKNRILNILIFLIISSIIFLPQGIFFINHPNTFLSRAETVYIFSKPASAWANYNDNSLGILFKQTQKTFDIFSGDNSSQYGYRGQLIDWVSILFLILGLFAVLRLKIKIKVFLFSWFIISLLGQILTSIPSPIFLPRFVIGLPLLYIFISLGIFEFSKLLNFFPFKKYLKPGLIFFSIITIVIFNLTAYFFLSPKNSIADAGSRISTEVSNYLINKSKNSIVYFYTEPYLYIDYPTLRFLNPDLKKISTGISSPKNFYIPYLHDLHGQTAILIIIPEYSFILTKLADIYPQGETKLINAKTGQFYSFEIN